MVDVPTGTVYDYVKLAADNLIWPSFALGACIWLARHPEVIARITTLDVFGVKLTLGELKKTVDANAQRIAELEEDVESGKRIYNDLLAEVQVNTAGSEALSDARRVIKTEARAVTDFDRTAKILKGDGSLDELYGAAVLVRERLPLDLFPAVLDCLDRLAKDPKLGGARLNTVWMLTSAAHRMLIASVRDGGIPSISREDLTRAANVLGALGRNKSVLEDRPDKPEKGIRGPLKHARTWVAKGLAPASPR
jgi:hypothetical protein